MIQLGAERFNQEAIAERFGELALAPEQLRVVERTRVRVYFVGENAGLQNSLGISLDPPGEKHTAPQLIFPNATTNTNLIESAKRIRSAGGAITNDTHGQPTEAQPVIPGDFVDLGMVEADTTLNFFLVSDGGRHGNQRFWPDPEDNPDGVQHMVAIAMPDSPYMIVSFEDMLGGGDKDYSDCVFAVSLSNYNMKALLGKIDPWRRVKQAMKTGAFIALVVGGPIAALRYYRRRRKQRLREQLQKTSALLDADSPTKALAMIRREKRRTRDKAITAEWHDLELSACEMLEDVDSISHLFDEDPSGFTEHEQASLCAARAALENQYQETFTEVVALWRDRKSSSDAWTNLTADALIRQDKQEEARNVLEARTLDPTHEAGRRARLAALRVVAEPNEARADLQALLADKPTDAGVYLYGCRVLEQLKKAPDAARLVEHAVELAPHDPFVRNEAGDFYQRQGNMMRALQLWCAGLNPPSTGFLWLKTLFWHRVALPVPILFAELPRPQGPLRPLIELLVKLPPQQFWNEAVFAPLVKRMPELEGRQEVYWLRLLEHLRTRHEEEALVLLNLSPFGQHAWHPQLETALKQIVTYRKYGFLDKISTTGMAANAGSEHPFFQSLHHWATTGEADPRFLDLMQSEDAFTAALLAAEWYEAGLGLQHAAHFRDQFPGWYIRNLEDAFRHNDPKSMVTRFNA